MGKAPDVVGPIWKPGEVLEADKLIEDYEKALRNIRNDNALGIDAEQWEHIYEAYIAGVTIPFLAEKHGITNEEGKKRMQNVLYGRSRKLGDKRETLNLGTLRARKRESKKAKEQA